MNGPTGWWLWTTTEPTQVPGHAFVDRDTRVAVLMSSRDEVRDRFHIQGHTYDPAAVLAWLNEGKLP